MKLLKYGEMIKKLGESEDMDTLLYYDFPVTHTIKQFSLNINLLILNLTIFNAE